MNLPSKSHINRIGDNIRSNTASVEEITTLEGWRAAHLYVLNTFQANLRMRTREMPVVVAQRLKRRETIFNKLARQPNMMLSRMHDIAGCRIIFATLRDLEQFRETFHKSRMLHKLLAQDDRYNYIAHPKANGYRGIHDVYEYVAKTEKGRIYNGLKIEIQYRTIYQHAWATAVEAAGLLTRNRPKFDEGDCDYLEFFRLASEIIARTHENCRSALSADCDHDIATRFKSVDQRIRLLSLFASVNIDPAPNRYSFITRVRRYFGPDWTGLQTLRA